MRIDTASDAADVFRPLFAGLAEERVAVAHLDESRRLIGLTLERSAGGADEVPVPVRAIIANALRLGSASILVAHNHPSGNASPSEEDLRGTRALAEAAGAVGIRLYDHLVFAGGQWRSFRAQGLL